MRPVPVQGPDNGFPFASSQRWMLSVIIGMTGRRVFKFVANANLEKLPSCAFGRPCERTAAVDKLCIVSSQRGFMEVSCAAAAMLAQQRCNRRFEQLGCEIGDEGCRCSHCRAFRLEGGGGRTVEKCFQFGSTSPKGRILHATR